jgi:sulfite reductase (NADPH) hemoprotein beta-component
MTVQVVTANRLRDGVIVWLTPELSWSEDYAESKVLRDEAEAKAALDAAGVDVKARLVVGPYLAEFEETPEGLQATSARERIRASRLPTITPDQGSWTGRIEG